MTVADLIAELQKMPQEAVVVGDEVTQGFVGVIPARGAHVRKARRDGTYYGAPLFRFTDTISNKHDDPGESVVVIS